VIPIEKSISQTFFFGLPSFMLSVRIHQNSQQRGCQ
jgi:hypothetical protein